MKKTLLKLSKKNHLFSILQIKNEGEKNKIKYALKYARELQGRDSLRCKFMSIADKYTFASCTIYDVSYRRHELSLATYLSSERPVHSRNLQPESGRMPYLCYAEVTPVNSLIAFPITLTVNSLVRNLLFR